MFTLIISHNLLPFLKKIIFFSYIIEMLKSLAADISNFLTPSLQLLWVIFYNSTGLLNIYYVSIIPDRYRSVSVFISDRPSVSIGTEFFGMIFITERGWNAPILKVIRGLSDSYISAQKTFNWV